MAIDYGALTSRVFPDIRHRYSARDTMLYALGLGVGADPVNPDDLRYVYEDDLLALPSMATILGAPGFWLKENDCGVDWRMVLHAEQSVEILEPLPAEGEVLARTRVEDILDKGLGRGALMYQRRDLFDAASGRLIAIVRQSNFIRGHGGFGGPEGPLKPVHRLPDRKADAVVVLPVRPDAALLYRLSGDFNPLHADPAVARAAGFDRPVLHGLCTYGMVCRALVRHGCEGRPDRIRLMDCRFTSTVSPGQALKLEIWMDGLEMSFRCAIADTGVVVLDNGRAAFAAP